MLLSYSKSISLSDQYCIQWILLNPLIGGGGCNPKKPYPSLTFSRVGVGFFWVLLGFFGFFWVFKKLIIFADFLYTQCENMHML